MIFSEKLKETMDSLNLTQKHLCDISGINKATISQYLSGKIEPHESRKKELAVMLGLNENYFIDEETETVAQQLERMNVKNNVVVDRLDVRIAARMLQMGHETVRKGLQQGVFPWGYAVHTSENAWTYFINAKRFAEIERLEV